jgi:hypothetical protein
MSTLQSAQSHFGAWGASGTERYRRATLVNVPDQPQRWQVPGRSRWERSGADDGSVGSALGADFVPCIKDVMGLGFLNLPAGDHFLLSLWVY